ncbi:hypothetical protein E2C01_006229 [Portunus trituberculatus]|uniref:Uncharacterized protein n=1 Tax=Portunus trituberculatus TaxID=210409 RepID=A0A5B7CXB2_PORTR|nr:hypothetical protein [Portunus trituberculatus]
MNAAQDNWATIEVSPLQAVAQNNMATPEVSSLHTPDTNLNINTDNRSDTSREGQRPPFEHTSHWPENNNE